MFMKGGSGLLPCTPLQLSLLVWRQFTVLYVIDKMMYLSPSLREVFAAELAGSGAPRDTEPHVAPVPGGSAPADLCKEDPLWSGAWLRSTACLRKDVSSRGVHGRVDQ